jgi:hypothetical protein
MERKYTRIDICDDQITLLVSHTDTHTHFLSSTYDSTSMSEKELVKL